MTDRKHPPRDWERSVDKQIREAMEHGEFDGLPRRGKPLDLEENPFTPRDWQLAFKMLQDAGVSPDWIEQDKEIRIELKALGSLLEQNARRLKDRRANVKMLAPDRMIVEYERLAQARQQTCDEYRERAAALNRQIDTFNLKVPSSRMHHPRIRIDREIVKFLDACS